MKTRSMFVSNSSSSSFIIPLSELNDKQITSIKNHTDTSAPYNDAWNIECGKFQCVGVIRGDTNMDNFDMDQHLKDIGVADKHITWGEEWDNNLD